MKTPLVSIIIPTYNRAHLIGETLDSVRAQTYNNWECIVVDDGSTDKTDKLLASYCEKDNRFQYHHRPIDRPKGANACRNYGFELSKGEFVQFLDSDDICENFCLSERVMLMSKDTNLNLLIRDTSFFIDNKKQYYSANKDPKIMTKEEYLRMFLRYEIPWPIMSAFYKRKLLFNCKFNESLSRFQDISFNIRILSENNELNFLRDFKIDCFYRIDKNKLQIKGFIEILYKSLITFNKIHINLMVNPEYRRDLQLFNYHFFMQYLMIFFNNNRRSSNIFIICSIKSKLFNFKQRVSLVLLFIYINTGLIYIKGVGAHRFRKYFINSFSN